MKKGPVSFSFLALALCLGCAEKVPDPTVTVHYLGHASFLLRFGENPGEEAGLGGGAMEEEWQEPSHGEAITVLTDFGASRAYGLDSPIHPLGEARPDIATFSHAHEDHAGGVLPEGIPVILTGGGVPGGAHPDAPGGAHPAGPHQEGDLTITPIPTFEGSLEAPDNTSFLFEYRGLKILHLGDCQGLMAGLAEAGAVHGAVGLAEARTADAAAGAAAGAGEETALLRARIRNLYPGPYDLVLLPIGFVSDILAEAAEFASLLDARRIVPMHFWSPADRDTYLAMMEGGENAFGQVFRTRAEPGPVLRVEAWAEDPDVVEVIGLAPGPTG